MKEEIQVIEKRTPYYIVCCPRSNKGRVLDQWAYRVLVYSKAVFRYRGFTFYLPDEEYHYRTTGITEAGSGRCLTGSDDIKTVKKAVEFLLSKEGGVLQIEDNNFYKQACENMRRLQVEQISPASWLT